MYKTFLETLDRAGVQIPTWVFLIVSVVIVFILIVLMFIKFIVPAILKITAIYTDVCSIKDLKDVQMKTITESIEGDTKIENQLLTFMEEMRSEIKTFTSNRIHDREQSIEIQKELSNSIKIVADGQKTMDNQISALMCGTKELLGNAIDERYVRYVTFVSL